MKLRELKNKDAVFMLEWMQDEDVTKDLNTNFREKSLDDCISFINNINKSDLHLAIVDDNDEYQGTVSLKGINLSEKNAEFAITIRKCAMGKGISSLAMKEILSIGINTYGLKNIYWCVNKSNARAVKFYDKNKYERCDNVPENIYNKYNLEIRKHFIWYCYK